MLQEKEAALSTPIDIGAIGQIEYTTESGQRVCELLFSKITGDCRSREILTVGAKLGAMVVWEIANPDQREGVIYAACKAAVRTHGAESAILMGYHRALYVFWATDTRDGMPQEFARITAAADASICACMSMTLDEFLAGGA